MNKLQTLHKLDTKDTLIVVSTYPYADTNRAYSAMDRYGQKKIQDIAKMRPVVICAQYYDKGSVQSITNGAITRIWKKGDIFSLLRMAQYILNFKSVRTVLIEFEFNVFGGTFSNLALLFVLGLLRLGNKQVIFELHQVVTHIGQLKDHLHITSLLARAIYGIGIRMYYVFLGVVCNKVVVLEQELKNRLASYISPAKIVVAPHHMDLHKSMSKLDARKKIGIKPDNFAVLAFGYLNHYKGIDWLAKVATKWSGKNILVIAGGPNPYHIQKPYYRAYYDSLLRVIRKSRYIRYTDFVPESKIKQYFSAADLVILPYRVFMAASGPFSIALSYKKPIILSDALKDYQKSTDFSDAMKKAGLTERDIFFPLRESHINKLIERFRADKKYRNRLKLFSQTLALSRVKTCRYSQLDQSLSGTINIEPRPDRNIVPVMASAQIS